MDTELHEHIELDRLVRVLRQVMADRRKALPDVIDADTSLEDLDLDSLDVAEVFLALEDDLGCRLDSESIDAPEVVRDLLRIRRAT